jgi:prevent-host-death family protein
MSKKISASDAKNNFGGLLDVVAALGRVDVMKHGRLVAVVLSPRAFDAFSTVGEAEEQDGHWGKMHMIPAELARDARMLNRPGTFDEVRRWNRPGDTSLWVSRAHSFDRKLPLETRGQASNYLSVSPISPVISAQ